MKTIGEVIKEKKMIIDKIHARVENEVPFRLYELNGADKVRVMLVFSDGRTVADDALISTKYTYTGLTQMICYDYIAHAIEAHYNADNIMTPDAALMKDLDAIKDDEDIRREIVRMLKSVSIDLAAGNND